MRFSFHDWMTWVKDFSIKYSTKNLSGSYWVDELLMRLENQIKMMWVCLESFVSCLEIITLTWIGFDLFLFFIEIVEAADEISENVAWDCLLFALFEGKVWNWGKNWSRIEGKVQNYVKEGKKKEIIVKTEERKEKMRKFQRLKREKR